MKPKKTIQDLSDSLIEGKRVLIRTDFNVPIIEGRVTSDHRIRATLPTLKYLLERKAKLVLVTHLGRPKGEHKPEFSVSPVVTRLQELLPDVSVKTIELPIDDKARTEVDTLKPGEIAVLENIRFEPGETKNSPELAKSLASLCDIYVNDAFGAAHRAHASTEGVTAFVGHKVAGLLMGQELEALSVLTNKPESPYTAIIGGSKVSTKIGVLKNLIKHVNNVVIGGGMVFTFLKAQGYNVGNSLVEDDQLEMAKQLLKDCEATETRIILPTDVVVAEKFAADAQYKTVSVKEIPDGWMGLDIGPDSTRQVMEVLKDSKTVFWNGPLGVFEFEPFAKATKAVAETLAQQTRNGRLTSVLGGGDTEAAIETFGIAHNNYTHVSTGGGASLELLEGKDLPGITALDDKSLASISS